MKAVAVLGATGSIGRSAIDVIRHEAGRLRPALFTAHRNAAALRALGAEFPGARVVLTGGGGTASANPVDADAAIPRIGAGDLKDALVESGAEIAVNGVAGAAGLPCSLACVEAGVDLALANKETVVMAGPLVLDAARRRGVRIIPVDSEHAAIWRLIAAHGADAVDEIVLTASGGPFRTAPLERLARVTPAEAVAHPTWRMGAKISVDSATLANKGLEVIEAAQLFGFPPGRIRVVIHPQSVVHAMIRLRDGAVYAQLSRPDMRLPIHEALCWPDVRPSPTPPLDFAGLSLTFETPDAARFPMLALAYEALERGPLGPAAYNAANEEAVSAFLSGRVGFLDIFRVTAEVLRGEDWGGDDGDLEAVTAADRRARARAAALAGAGAAASEG